MNETTRRTVLAGAAGVSAGVSAAALLGACADSSASTGSTTSQQSEPAVDPANSLGRTSDIPVNGGKVFVDQGVVVTQPTPGEFKAFSGTCTHKGCAVSSVADGTINCKCHGAKFALADGSVQAGPATKSLEARTIKVQHDTISLA